jgi:hypothetical protein
MAKANDNIQELEKRVAKFERDVERAEAVRECINAANRYQVCHRRNMNTERTLEFALKTPGTAVEMLWGTYDEPDAVIRWSIAQGMGQLPGKLTGNRGSQHAICTPIVEVAGDCKTAKGLWLLFAYYGGAWAAGQFAMDFIKEDGKWKVWKYNTTGLIYSQFEKGWLKQNGRPKGMDDRTTAKGDIEPSRPPTWYWMWGPDQYFQNIPMVPEPYETWDDSLACIPPPGRQWKIEKFD